MLPAEEPLPAGKALAALAAGVALLGAADGPYGITIQGKAATGLLEQALCALWPADAGPAAPNVGAASHGLPDSTAAGAAAAAAILAAPPSPAAAALAAALERHCRGVSLAQLHTSALVLHISLTCLWATTLVTSDGPLSPACRACARRALQRCSLLLHSGGSEVAGYCCRVALDLADAASPELPLAAVDQMLEQGLACAKEGQCEWPGPTSPGALCSRNCSTAS